MDGRCNSYPSGTRQLAAIRPIRRKPKALHTGLRSSDRSRSADRAARTALARAWREHSASKPEGVPARQVANTARSCEVYLLPPRPTGSRDRRSSPARRSRRGARGDRAQRNLVERAPACTPRLRLVRGCELRAWTGCAGCACRLSSGSARVSRRCPLVGAPLTRAPGSRTHAGSKVCPLQDSSARCRYADQA